MSKKTKLVTLDALVLDKMITIMESEKPDATDALGALTPAINYLRNNQEVAERSKGTVEEDTARRLSEAAKRRAKKMSK